MHLKKLMVYINEVLKIATRMLGLGEKTLSSLSLLIPLLNS